MPWHVWIAVLSSVCAMVGGHRDIAWHRSIGRDAFWTPPHVVLYLCGVLAAFWSTTLIVKATATRERGRVTIWRLRGPLGAFVSTWGGATMLTAAPFDDWWHGAYGLDVKIVSPPHVMLILGILAVYLGTLLLVVGELNRATGEGRRVLSGLFLFVSSGVVVALMLLLMEYTHPVEQHGARFYRVVCWMIPLVLAAVRVCSERRWASTTVAALYTAFHLALLWILPLVSAEPKLGPVYQPVTHLIPPAFPVLLIVPALLIDASWSRLASLWTWPRSVISGLGFFAALVAVEWPFACFMLSPLARNAIFGADYVDYNMPPTSFVVRHAFLSTEQSTAAFALGMALAAAGAVLSCALGFAWGRWMTRVQR